MSVAVLACALLTHATSTPAGEIEPGLRAAIEAASSSTKWSVILYPREQAPIEELSRALDARNATRQERHRRVVESLRETASRSQAAILAALEDERASGAVSGLTSFWITNCIVLEADRGAMERLAIRNSGDPRAVVRFSLASAGLAELVVYDVAGREVRTLMRESLSAGPHEAVWDGRDDRGHSLGSGVYWCRLRAAGYESARRMIRLP